MEEKMTQDPLAIARASLLAPTGVEDRHLDDALGRLLTGGVESADLYFQYVRHENWSLEDGAVKEGSHSIDQGVGVRAIAGEKTGFAYSDELVVPALMSVSDAASAIARRGQSGQLQAWKASSNQHLYPAIDPLVTLEDDAKVQLLQDVDAYARKLDPRIRQVMAGLAAVHEVVLVCSSDSLW